MTTKYTHHDGVDGDTTYGYTWLSLPRRDVVGGYFNDMSWSGQIFYPGSRSLIAYHSTGFKHGGLSII